MRSSGIRIGFIIALAAFTRTLPGYAGEVRVPLGISSALSVPVTVRSVKELREDGIILQRLDYSCGSAALATLFTSYLGQPYAEVEIIDFITRTGDVQKIVVRKGFSLLDLKRFAESHGVRADGYALDFEGLSEFRCPVLVPLYRKAVDMRHFVIVRGIIGDRVFLADPALGRQTMMRAEFERVWQPRVGMVFTNTHDVDISRPLALGVADEHYLAPEVLRVITLRSAIDYIHQAKEF